MVNEVATSETPIEMKDDTTIPCKKITRIRIKDYGKKGESYDHLLNRIMDLVDKIEKGEYVLKGD